MASITVSTFTRTLIDEAEKQAKVRQNHLTLPHTKNFFHQLISQALSLLMAAHQGLRVSFEIWPFHKDSFKGVKREDSAWPHEEGKVFGPMVGWFEWSGGENDEFWLTEIAKALKELRKVALEEGCTTEDMPMYPNIALEDTSINDIYRDHYEELKLLRNKYDPNNVMGLAAGFVVDASK